MTDDNVDCTDNKRLELLKAGVLAGAAFVITDKKTLGAEAGEGLYRDLGDTRLDVSVQSPAIRAFIEDLPIPPIAQPVAQLDPAPAEFAVLGEAPRAPHQ